MTEPLACPRCRRSFGGHFTFRRAHPGRRCRRIVGLRAIGLHLDAEGVWRRSGPTDPVQLRFPLFGPGRPRKVIPQYFSGTANRRSTARRTPGPGTQLRLVGAA